MQKIGYARVSTREQSTDAQRLALRKAGCSTVFQEQAGGTAKRPELQRAIETLGEGDTLTVFRFDRLARSLTDLIEIVRQIEERGAHIESLSEKIDTSGSMGQLVFHIMGALGQFERDLIRERTQAGLEAAAEAGRKGGRPRALSDRQIDHALQLVDESGESVRAVARSLKVGKSTLARALQERRDTLTPC